MPVPEYLRCIAYDEIQKKNHTLFKAKCVCGCVKFDFFESFLNKQEQEECQPHYEALGRLLTGGYASTCTVDEDGTIHHWKLLSADGPKEEVIVPNAPYYSLIKVIKIKCCECGKEYVLFDSRFNGYSGMFCNNNSPEAEEYVPHFKQRKRRSDMPVEICIKVEHDPSFEDFKENTGIECSFEDYSNAYTWIWVYEVNLLGKKRMIFECESD